MVVNAPSGVSTHSQQSIRCVASLGDSNARCIRTAFILRTSCCVLPPPGVGVGEDSAGAGVGSAGKGQTVTWRKLEYCHILFWGRAGLSMSYTGVKEHYI